MSDFDDIFGSSSSKEFVSSQESTIDNDSIEIAIEPEESVILFEEFEPVLGGRLEKIQKQMEAEKKKFQKQQMEMLEGGVVGNDALGGNRLRINKNLVLESTKELIAAAIDVQQKEGDAALDAFWVMDNVIPFKVVEKLDPSGKERNDREVTRVINRIKEDIKKMEKGMLKRGRNIVRKKKFGDFTLIYWPGESVKKPQTVTKIILEKPGPLKRVIAFENFDLPALPLSSKTNPFLKKMKFLDFKEFLRAKGKKVDFSLEDNVDAELREIIKSRLIEVLTKIKGLTKEEIVEESEVRNIGPNKYDFIREKVKQFNDAGELEIIKDEVGEKILSAFLSENDVYQQTAMIVYHFRRLDPRIATKNTLLDYYGNIMSYGLIDYLGKKRRTHVEDVIYKNILNQPLDSNYKYILEVGFVPTVIDEFNRQRQIMDRNGFEIELFNALAQILYTTQFSQEDLKNFLVGKAAERISKEQWDVINSEWEIYKVQYDDPSDYDDAISELEPQSADDLRTSKNTLKNEVDELEAGIYGDSDNVKEYVLKAGAILAVLEMDVSNNIKNRINSRIVGIENLHMLTLEELLPELFLSPELNVVPVKRESPRQDYLEIIELEMNNKEMKEILEFKVAGSIADRFRNWLINKIYIEANMLLAIYMPMVKKDWFPIEQMPLRFDVQKFAVSESKLCGTLNSNKYYVMTSTGIKCMSKDDVTKNLSELKKYNRKDLEEMINL